MRRAFAVLSPCILLGCAAPGDDAGADGSTAAIADGSTAASTGAGGSSDGPGREDGSGGSDDSTGAAPCADGREPAAASEIEGCAALVGTPLCSEGQMHVTQDAVVPWQHDPPASGPHYPTWAAWGEHTGVVPRGNWVHNLEHGGIVLSYRCNDDCEPELQTLRDVLAARQQLRILLTKDPLLPGQERFAAIAWTWVLRFDAPDLATLTCFADQHENHAPEDVPAAVGPPSDQ
ncbi:MAG: DUF3105 domain-containing protein [Nannocystaceae bacterium]|nr:DUF3105 domain-containing protein [Nannocystaceae bacterium]